MRIFVAALGTETNTFSPIPTALRNFEEYCLLRPNEHPDHPLEFTAPLWIARQRVQTEGWHVTEGTCAFALPAGPTARATYEGLRDEILGQIEAALPLDAVAISMHGAMVANGYDDCEGDMMQRVRSLVGDTVALGLELDPHCHLSEKMVRYTDATVIFKEYPHTDFLERAEELLDILAGVVSKQLRPRSSVYDCRIIGMYHTTREPMKQFIVDIQALEGKEGVLSISIAHGFPWGDVEDIGTRVLVITDDAPDKGALLANDLGQRLIAMRGRTSSELLTISAGLERAERAPIKPVVIADTSDNPGGGAPGDSTFVLRELLDRKIKGACLGPLWDPIAVQICMAAGIGSVQQLRIGGKIGPASGEPLDVTAKVTGLRANATQSFAGATANLGDCAAIQIDGVQIVLSSLRIQALGLDLFRGIGIEPTQKDIVVVKSSQHFSDAFAPIAGEVLYVNGPGALIQDVTRLRYTKIRRQIWPLNDDPFNEAG